MTARASSKQQEDSEWQGSTSKVPRRKKGGKSKKSDDVKTKKKTKDRKPTQIAHDIKMPCLKKYRDRQSKTTSSKGLHYNIPFNQPILNTPKYYSNIIGLALQDYVEDSDVLVVPCPHELLTSSIDDIEESPDFVLMLRFICAISNEDNDLLELDGWNFDDFIECVKRPIGAIPSQSDFASILDSSEIRNKWIEKAEEEIYPSMTEFCYHFLTRLLSFCNKKLPIGRDDGTPEANYLTERAIGRMLNNNSMARMCLFPETNGVNPFFQHPERGAELKLRHWNELSPIEVSFTNTTRN